MSALIVLNTGVMPVFADNAIPTAPNRLRRNQAPAPNTSKLLNGAVSQSLQVESAPTNGGGLISNENMQAFSSSPQTVSAPLVQTNQFQSKATAKIAQPAQVSQSAPANKKGGFSSQDARKALEIGLGVASFLGSAVSRGPVARINPSYTPSVPSNLVGSAFNGRQLTKQELAVLASYDVAIVIDKSGSMSTSDCPGGMTRWDWCRDQMLGFSRQTASAFRHGIDVLLFSSSYQAFANVDFSAVKNVFTGNSPGGGTQMSKPLEAVFDEHFRKRDQMGNTKKLIVEVISDGEPSDKGEVASVIARATQRMQRPDEITVSFLQIGNERDGASALNRFDNDLMREGALQDIVDVEPFYIVSTQGLSQAILNAAQRRR